jgi:alanine-glyoxylate transaminase / serine-glyoxylate transaminase / serine-pyruvate transaminase
MSRMNAHRSGRHFLQIPGPTNVPDRILRAIDQPTIDHRGPEFQGLASRILAELRMVFQTRGPVVIYPASGTGAWEAALVNTLSPGDTVLMSETGHFAALWKRIAEKLGLRPLFLGSFERGSWRRGVDLEAIEARLEEDTRRDIKAVCVVHNETSTGAVSDILGVRRALDRTHHPALLMVDTISSLGSLDYRHDEWGVDVTIAGSQKGLMLPPGLSFNAVSEKARAAAKSAQLPKAFWAWEDMLEANAKGFFPYTPATNLLYGLGEAIEMLLEEGLPNVFARHARLAEATRRAVAAWGLEILCEDPAARSNVLTAVVMPAEPNGRRADADRLRAIIHSSFDMSLGQGLGKLAGWVFRVGHLGDLNALMLAGTLSGVEMGLALAGVPHKPGGAQAALAYLTQTAKRP